MDYFSHDTDASSDEKIEPLIMLYGSKGYMFYFYHLERIYRQPNFELDISDAETRQLYACKIQITEQEYNDILKSCLKYRSFDRNEYEKRHVLTSDGIKKRASVVLKKREYMRGKGVTVAETTQKKHSNVKTTPKVKESKVKKSKAQESKKEYGTYKNVQLTDAEMSRLIDDYGSSTIYKAIDFLDMYIAEKNYKSKSHNIAMRRWVIEAVNKNNQQPKAPTNAVNDFYSRDKPQPNPMCPDCNGTGKIMLETKLGEETIQVPAVCKCVERKMREGRTA